MKHAYWLASISLLFVAAASTAGAADLSRPFKNAQVVVTEHTLQPGQSLPLSDQRPSVVVYFSGNKAATGSQSRPIQRGETTFLAAEIKAIRDTGSEPLHFVRIAFLGNGNTETWGMTGLPPNYKMVLENRYTRVYDIRIPAHFKEPLHTHHGRIVVCLSGAKLEHLLPDGHVQPSTLTTGEVVWRPGQTHVGHNIGNTNLWAIAVEPR
jgi:hypothetical protein